MPRAGFEPATPATKRPQTYDLHRAATGIGSNRLWEIIKKKSVYLGTHYTLHVTERQMTAKLPRFTLGCYRSICILTPWHQNPKVHHRIHNSMPPVPILSQIDPIHSPPANHPKILSDAILPSTPLSSTWSFSFWLSHQNPIPCLHILKTRIKSPDNGFG
jgi:hypothetical protein